MWYALMWCDVCASSLSAQALLMAEFRMTRRQRACGVLPELANLQVCSRAWLCAFPYAVSGLRECAARACRCASRMRYHVHCAYLNTRRHAEMRAYAYSPNA